MCLTFMMILLYFNDLLAVGVSVHGIEKCKFNVNLNHLKCIYSSPFGSFSQFVITHVIISVCFMG